MYSAAYELDFYVQPYNDDQTQPAVNKKIKIEINVKINVFVLLVTF